MPLERAAFFLRRQDINPPGIGAYCDHIFSGHVIGHIINGTCRVMAYPVTSPLAG